MNSAAGIAVRLCQEIYDPVTPGMFDSVIRINETVCGLKREGKLLRIVLQGTSNIAGWEADFDALPVEHPVLGHIHSGFYKNLVALWGAISPALSLLLPTDQIEVSGHSKGAGEGVILAGMLHERGYHVVCFLFACPNAGYADFRTYMSAVPGTSFRNAPPDAEWFGDPVPNVPPFPYVPTYPHVLINVPPAGFERMLNVEWHLINLYQTAFADIAETVVATVVAAKG